MRYEFSGMSKAEANFASDSTSLTNYATQEFTADPTASWHTCATIVATLNPTSPLASLVLDYSVLRTWLRKEEVFAGHNMWHHSSGGRQTVMAHLVFHDRILPLLYLVFCNASRAF